MMRIWILFRQTVLSFRFSIWKASLMNNLLMSSFHYDNHSGVSLLTTTIQSAHAVIGYRVTLSSIHCIWIFVLQYDLAPFPLTAPCHLWKPMMLSTISGNVWAPNQAHTVVRHPCQMLIKTQKTRSSRESQAVKQVYHDIIYTPVFSSEINLRDLSNICTSFPKPLPLAEQANATIWYKDLIEKQLRRWTSQIQWVKSGYLAGGLSKWHTV